MQKSSMKSLIARYCVPALWGILLPTIAWGHPGHGNPAQEQTIWHYLLEPEHLFPVFAGVLITGSLCWIWATRDRMQQ